MDLETLPTRLAVCRLEPGTEVPAWATISTEFVSVTRTSEELSIVCSSDVVPEGIAVETPWRAFRVQGPIVMTLIGVLASIADPLADEGISIFAVSTFDTDYVLVHEADFERAGDVLVRAGHTVVAG